MRGNYLLAVAGMGLAGVCSPVLGQAGGAAASQGSAAVETQMIAYRALGKIAENLAGRVAMDLCKGAVCAGDGKTAVLLAEANSLAELASYRSFEQAVGSLTQQYAALEPGVHPRGFGDVTLGAGSLIAAIRSSATYTNQNFQPTAQSFVTLLSVDLQHAGLVLRTAGSPGDQIAAQQYVEKELGGVFAAQKQVDAKARAAVDAQFTSFLGSLGAVSADGTVLLSAIKGRALSEALGQEYGVLTVSVDAAGGDTKVTHFGLYEILFPTPAPAYNGGAVVSFTLADRAGNLRDGDVLAGMYRFTKLKSPSLQGADRVVDPAKPTSMTRK